MVVNYVAVAHGEPVRTTDSAIDGVGEADGGGLFLDHYFLLGLHCTLSSQFVNENAALLVYLILTKVLDQDAVRVLLMTQHFLRCLLRKPLFMSYRLSLLGVI